MIWLVLLFYISIPVFGLLYNYIAGELLTPPRPKVPRPIRLQWEYVTCSCGVRYWRWVNSTALEGYLLPSSPPTKPWQVDDPDLEWFTSTAGPG